MNIVACSVAPWKLALTSLRWAKLWKASLRFEKSGPTTFVGRAGQDGGGGGAAAAAVAVAVAVAVADSGWYRGPGDAEQRHGGDQRQPPATPGARQAADPRPEKVPWSGQRPYLRRADRAVAGGVGRGAHGSVASM